MNELMMSANRNSAVTPSSAIIQHQPPSIEDYTAKQIDSTNKYDNLIKVLVIGDAGVGKSSILKRYNNDVFDYDQSSTIGVDFVSVYMQLLDESKRKFVYKYQIWDCAGQERFQSIVRSYIREANVILFTFDITDDISFEHIQRWVTHINNNINQNYIPLLVGNKCDRKDRVITKQQAQSLAKSLNADYIELSAKSGHNISLLFETIAKLTHKNIIEKFIAPVSMNELYRRDPVVGGLRVTRDETEVTTRCGGCEIM